MSVEPSRTLLRIDQARLALEQAKDLSEIKAIRDQAEAMRQYARIAQMGLEAQNHAAEIKLRAERRAGELLAEQGRKQGQRDQTFEDQTYAPPKLEQLKISRFQAHRWQTVAAVPEPVFEQHVAEVRSKPDGEITTSAVVDIGRQYQAEKRAAEREAKEQARDAEPPAEIPFDLVRVDR